MILSKILVLLLAFLVLFLAIVFIVTSNKLRETEADLERSQKNESSLEDKIYSLEIKQEKSQESLSSLLKENNHIRERLQKLLLLYIKDKFIEDSSSVEDYLNSILENEGDLK